MATDKPKKITVEKKVQLQTLTSEELKTTAAKIRSQIVLEKVAKATGKAKNLRREFILRKQLARILTELSNKLIENVKIPQKI